MLRHVRQSHGNQWTCGSCHSTFDSDKGYAVHQRSCGAPDVDIQVASTSSAATADQGSMAESNFVCTMCDRGFTKRCNVLRHIGNNRAGQWTCATCRVAFTREDNYTYHRWTCEFRTTDKRPAESQVSTNIVNLLTP